MNRSTRGFARPGSENDSECAKQHNQPEFSGRFVATPLRGRDAVPQIIYLLTLAAVGLPLCIRILLTIPLPGPRTTLLLSALGLVSYHLPVALPSRINIHPGFPLLMSALYCYDIAAAVLVVVPSALLVFFTGKRGLCNCLFNAGQFTLCLYATRCVGLWAGWQPGVPADSRALAAILLMILTYDVLNALLVTGAICIDTKRPFRECFVRTCLTQRKAMLPQQIFMTVVAMLLSSHMGDIAFAIVFIGVISLRSQNIFQRELVVRTEEAETDPLTKTYNMRYLDRWLTAKLSTAADGKNLCSFLFADIDGMKSVNDRYGHDTGDNLLIHVTQILLGSVRAQDQVVRYGGDEFVVALPGIDLEQATAVASRIVQATRSTPFLAHGEKVEFGISVGVASWPEHGDTVLDAIRMADKAMYLAKNDQGDSVRSAAALRTSLPSSRTVRAAGEAISHDSCYHVDTLHEVRHDGQ